MKPPDEIRSEQVKQWVDKAEEDFAVAHHLLSSNTKFYSTICFHAQQASEKYLKSLLTFYSIEFPKTHSISNLLDLLSVKDKELADAFSQAEILSVYSVDSRYPGDSDDLSKTDAADAIGLTGLVRNETLGRLADIFNQDNLPRRE